MTRTPWRGLLFRPSSPVLACRWTRFYVGTPDLATVARDYLEAARQRGLRADPWTLEQIPAGDWPEPLKGG